MPVTPTYPGVYIEEIPSGVRTITGVATSITAFVGRARRGPVNTPWTINNFGDFDRVFGGLWDKSPMSFALRDFYLNGGAQAVIIRLFNPLYNSDAEREAAAEAAQAVAEAANQASQNPNATPESVALAAEGKVGDYENEPEKSAAKFVAAAARNAADAVDATVESVRDAASDAVNDATPITKAQLSVDTLKLEAAYEGSWGNNLRARVDHDVLNDNQFNLSVIDTRSGQSEQFRNLSVDSGAVRRVDTVLAQESQLVRISDTLPAERPNSSGPNDDGSVPPGADPFSEEYSSGVEEAGRSTDGFELTESDYQGDQVDKTGIFALEDADLFNILCIPPANFEIDLPQSVWSAAITYCEQRRAFLIIDPPGSWRNKTAAKDGLANDINITHKNAALFFPRLLQPNPLHEGQLEEFVPCGAVAGIFARTDTERGVWKAPAGLDARLRGVQALTVPLTDEENGELNPLGINCLRFKEPAGRVVWGGRTREGDDRLASEWKYIPVRRTALFIEESLFRGTQWVVFEPNDEPLWAQIRLNVGAFMQTLFLQGAFQGSTPREAYLVKCDSETTTQNDIDRGIVNILVGFAPLKPAEFVILKIQQLAGQLDT